MRLTCADCGQPIKPLRGAPGYWQHASRTTAACDLDSDHIPRPADDAPVPAPVDQPTRGQDDTSG
jgi:hypothetical protein